MSISISFTTSAAADKNYFSIEGSNNNIIVGVVSEDLNDKIAEFPYQGLSDSTNAMVSFYYLSKIKDLKGIIDMHYEGDGTQRYIKELLFDSPDSFSRAKNLSSINLRQKFFVGEHELLNYEMENVSGAKAMWFDEFVCEDNRCYKSNLFNIFGNGTGFSVFNRFIRAGKEKTSKPEGHYKKIALGNLFASEERPFELFLNIKEISKSELNNPWLLKLMKIRELEGVGDKMSALAEYLPQIFDGWENNKTVNFRFNSTSIEKDWFISNLANIHDFKVKGFFDTDKTVWIFVSALTFDNKRSNFIFVFDKQLEKFVMKSSRIYLSGFLMNEKVEQSFFEMQKGDDNDNKYHERKEDKVVDAFYNDLDVVEVKAKWAWGYLISIFLFFLFIFLLLYIRKNKRSGG